MIEPIIVQGKCRVVFECVSTALKLLVKKEKLKYQNMQQQNVIFCHFKFYVYSGCHFSKQKL